MHIADADATLTVELSRVDGVHVLNPQLGL